MYRALRNTLGANRNCVKGNGVKGYGNHFIMRSLIFCTAQSKFAVNKIENNEIFGACSSYGRRKFLYGVWWGILGVKTPLWGRRRKWEDNIKMDLQEVGFGVMDWIELAQYTKSWRALVNAVINLRVP